MDEIIRDTYRQGAAMGAAMVSEDLDYYYWLWAHGDSPLFGKEQMTTFERYFIADKETHFEQKDPYFDLIHDADFCCKIGREFGMEDDVIIVNGHVPVKITKGEDPVKKGGNAVTIDGAFSAAYGDQGYTLMLRPEGIELAEHSHFESINHFLINEADMQPQLRTLVSYPHRRKLGETREGKEKLEQLEILKSLLESLS